MFLLACHLPPESLGGTCGCGESCSLREASQSIRGNGATWPSAALGFVCRRLLGGHWGGAEAGLCADVHRDVGVEGQVLAREDLVLGRVHSVQLPGLTGLGQHVKSGDNKGDISTKLGYPHTKTLLLTPPSELPSY